MTSVLGTKTCSNKASKDFQFGVYDVLYVFFSLEMRLFTHACHIELQIVFKYHENNSKKCVELDHTRMGGRKADITFCIAIK